MTAGTLTRALRWPWCHIHQGLRGRDDDMPGTEVKWFVLLPTPLPSVPGSWERAGAAQLPPRWVPTTSPCSGSRKALNKTCPGLFSCKIREKIHHSNFTHYWPSKEGNWQAVRVIVTFQDKGAPSRIRTTWAQRPLILNPEAVGGPRALSL